MCSRKRRSLTKTDLAITITKAILGKKSIQTSNGGSFFKRPATIRWQEAYNGPFLLWKGKFCLHRKRYPLCSLHFFPCDAPIDTLIRGNVFKVIQSILTNLCFTGCNLPFYNKRNTAWGSRLKNFLVGLLIQKELSGIKAVQPRPLRHNKHHFQVSVVEVLELGSAENFYLGPSSGPTARPWPGL